MLKIKYNIYYTTAKLICQVKNANIFIKIKYFIVNMNKIVLFEFLRKYAEKICKINMGTIRLKIVSCP